MRWPDGRLLVGERREDEGGELERKKFGDRHVVKARWGGFCYQSPGKGARNAREPWAAASSCRGGWPRSPATRPGAAAEQRHQGSTSVGQSTWQTPAAPASRLLHGLPTQSKMALLTSPRIPPCFDPFKGETGCCSDPQLGLAQRLFLGCRLFAATNAVYEGDGRCLLSAHPGSAQRVGNRDWGKLKLYCNHSINVRNLLKRAVIKWAMQNASCGAYTCLQNLLSCNRQTQRCRSQL